MVIYWNSAQSRTCILVDLSPKVNLFVEVHFPMQDLTLYTQTFHLKTKVHSKHDGSKDQQKHSVSYRIVKPLIPHLRQLAFAKILVQKTAEPKWLICRQFNPPDLRDLEDVNTCLHVLNKTQWLNVPADSSELEKRMQITVFECQMRIMSGCAENLLQSVWIQTWLSMTACHYNKSQWCMAFYIHMNIH